MYSRSQGHPIAPPIGGATASADRCTQAADRQVDLNNTECLICYLVVNILQNFTNLTNILLVLQGINLHDFVLLLCRIRYCLK